jgi:hypothetical protein
MSADGPPGPHDHARCRVLRPYRAKTSKGKYEDSVVEWLRSSYCADSACVEVARIAHDAIGLRDSKNPDQPFLRFSRAAWSTFTEAIKAGDFQGR